MVDSQVKGPWSTEVRGPCRVGSGATRAPRAVASARVERVAKTSHLLARVLSTCTHLIHGRRCLGTRTRLRGVCVSLRHPCTTVARSSKADVWTDILPLQASETSSWDSRCAMCTVHRWRLTTHQTPGRAQLRPWACVSTPLVDRINAHAAECMWPLVDPPPTFRRGCAEFSIKRGGRHVNPSVEQRFSWRRLVYSPLVLHISTALWAPAAPHVSSKVASHSLAFFNRCRIYVRTFLCSEVVRWRDRKGSRRIL
jgi:hypothetical protein